MDRILILRHDATDLALLRAALASCEAELSIESFPTLGAGLVRLAEAREADEPFSAAVVALEGASAPLDALWEADQDLQVLLSLPTSESPDDLPAGRPGRVPVLLHLLAPNGRAQQITDDLAGFWARTYPTVRKELRARYPRHAWPEDPLAARAERRPRRKKG